MIKCSGLPGIFTLQLFFLTRFITVSTIQQLYCSLKTNNIMVLEKNCNPPKLVCQILHTVLVTSYTPKLDINQISDKKRCTGRAHGVHKHLKNYILFDNSRHYFEAYKIEFRHLGFVSRPCASALVVST